MKKISKSGSIGNPLGGMQFRASSILSSLAFASALICSSGAFAGTLEQAKRMHDRLAGVPPTETDLISMKNLLDTGVHADRVAAADIAMSHDAFYNVTLKNWASPWTNRDMDVFVPLNDYSATVIGLVRDEDDFRKVLFDDVIYTGTGVTAYANNSNQHYIDLEEGGHNLQTVLQRSAQSSVTGLPSEATAGVITSRAASRAFFKAGTNRAQLRFTLLNHLCRDLEQVHDLTGVPDRIRQDVSRSPGGDSSAFLNGCMGCHIGMDPLAQAFAYYDFEYDADNDLTGESGQLSYNEAGDVDDETGLRVKAKYHFNSATFKDGFVTPDDRWDNYWRQGPNSIMGWDNSLTGSGNGAKSMLTELAYSEAFAECQVKKSFKAVCFREPSTEEDHDHIAETLVVFQAENYNMKAAFAESAIYCMGD